MYFDHVACALNDSCARVCIGWMCAQWRIYIKWSIRAKCIATRPFIHSLIQLDATLTSSQGCCAAMAVKDKARCTVHKPKQYVWSIINHSTESCALEYATTTTTCCSFCHGCHCHWWENWDGWMQVELNQAEWMNGKTNTVRPGWAAYVEYEWYSLGAQVSQPSSIVHAGHPFLPHCRHVHTTIHSFILCQKELLTMQVRSGPVAVQCSIQWLAKKGKCTNKDKTNWSIHTLIFPFCDKCMSSIDWIVPHNSIIQCTNGRGHDESSSSMASGRRRHASNTAKIVIFHHNQNGQQNNDDWTINKLRIEKQAPTTRTEQTRQPARRRNKKNIESLVTTNPGSAEEQVHPSSCQSARDTLLRPKFVEGSEWSVQGLASVHCSFLGRALQSTLNLTPSIQLLGRRMRKGWMDNDQLVLDGVVR